MPRSELWKAGIEAQPVLERLVAESDDFEAVFRAKGNPRLVSIGHLSRHSC